MELCSECGKRPILNKKGRLCKVCYTKQRLENLPDYGLCIYCRRRPVTHIRRQLCAACYNLIHKKGLDDPLPAKSPEHVHHNCEIEFIKNFFTHPNWQYQPANFRLNGTTYSPDFYDEERNVFIEVSGSRQAYHANKDKYELFEKLFPKLSFEVRKPDGLLLDTNGRIDWQ